MGDLLCGREIIEEEMVDCFKEFSKRGIVAPILSLSEPSERPIFGHRLVVAYVRRIDGGNLGKYNGPFLPEIYKKLGEYLAFIGSRGVVHNDFVYHNIIVEKGTMPPYVVDWTESGFCSLDLFLNNKELCQRDINSLSGNLPKEYKSIFWGFYEQFRNIENSKKQML